jgi:hypothetical protein
MKLKLEGNYQIAKNAMVDVQNIDAQWCKIIQHAVCSCDRERFFLLRKRPIDKLLSYLRRDYLNTIYKCLLECPEVHHHLWNCPSPCWFRQNHPEIMTKVYAKLTAEKQYKIKRGCYRERGRQTSC